MAWDTTLEAKCEGSRLPANSLLFESSAMSWRPFWKCQILARLWGSPRGARATDAADQPAYGCFLDIPFAGVAAVLPARSRLRASPAA